MKQLRKSRYFIFVFPSIEFRRNRVSEIPNIACVYLRSYACERIFLPVIFRSYACVWIRHYKKERKLKKERLENVARTRASQNFASDAKFSRKLPARTRASERAKKLKNNRCRIARTRASDVEVALSYAASTRTRASDRATIIFSTRTRASERKRRPRDAYGGLARVRAQGGDVTRCARTRASASILTHRIAHTRARA